MSKPHSSLAFAGILAVAVCGADTYAQAQHPAQTADRVQAQNPATVQEGGQNAPLDPPGALSPNDHRPGGPSRPDPYGGDKAILLNRPDLALKPKIQLGVNLIPWGHSAILLPAASAYKKDGRCAFDYVYSTQNIGNTVSKPTKNKIMAQAPNGEVLAMAELPRLARRASADSTGHVLLAPGVTTLYVFADASDANSETNEQNNLRRVRVTLNGSCD